VELGSESQVDPQWKRHMLFSGTMLMLHTERVEADSLPTPSPSPEPVHPTVSQRRKLLCMCLYWIQLLVLLYYSCCACLNCAWYATCEVTTRRFLNHKLLRRQGRHACTIHTGALIVTEVRC
jgi:hypothetical protein